MDRANRLITRRDFIVKTTVASPFLFLTSRILGRENNPSPNNKLNIAFIGVGGRGGHNLDQFDGENAVALCDVDEKQAAKSFAKFENVPKYQDFRVMLDKHRDVDAVVVSTPDHFHAVAAMNAIQRGKHVYVEKPLAHTIHEVRALMKAAKENNVQTQLGNQGHSYDDIRKICELVWNGAIGDVREVHAWYTRQYGNGEGRPTEKPSVPETLDWNMWLGPAAERPYHSCYLPGKWRSWADFGTGVLGDWVCHILDPAVWALKLKAPVRITANNEGGKYSPERFPVQSVIEYEFAAREDMPPVKVIWTYGRGIDLPQLKEVELDDWNTTAGAILIGDKGSIVHGSHGGGNPRIVPASRAADVKTPEEIIPRVKGDHHQDWVRACKEGKPSGSNFSYGGPITELALLGVIATVFDKEPLEWNSDEANFTNHDKANRCIQQPYRQGWTL